MLKTETFYSGYINIEKKNIKEIFGKMSDKNCRFPQCAVSVTTKHAGIKLFPVITRKYDFYSKRRKEMVDTVSRFRVNFGNA